MVEGPHCPQWLARPKARATLLPSARELGPPLLRGRALCAAHSSLCPMPVQLGPSVHGTPGGSISPGPLMVPLLDPQIRETETRRGVGAAGHPLPDPSTDGGVRGTSWSRATAGGPARGTGVSPGRRRRLPSGGFESGTTA